MRVSKALASRLPRTLLLASIALGWAGIILGTAIDQQLLVWVGAAVVALGSLLVAKWLLELSTSIAAAHKNSAANQRGLDKTLIGVEALELRFVALADDVAEHATAIERLRSEAISLTAELTRQNDAATTASGVLAGSIDDLNAKLTNLTAAHDTTRTALAATRALADKLGEHARIAYLGESRLKALSAPAFDSPLLSIAIPSFNRPIAFKELLASIADEVAACRPGTVEVCITDDASPDLQTIETAVAFAERHPFASLRIQPANVGLERNVMAAGEPCRGEYLMLVGNDDLLATGVLTQILADIGSSDAPVLLYGKRRINLDGSARADVPGSIPIDIAAGETHRFDSIIDASRLQGLLSTFGFAGPLVVRREPFLAVDPDPYLDLTMYTPTAVLLEAFSRQPVLYHNLATILHRTATPEHKHAEALGRREEQFMAGGRTRLARYHGTSLAATLQRLIDRGALDHETVSALPERLITDLPLVAWLARNRKIDPGVDERLGATVVADADRFFAAQDTLASRKVR